MPIMISTRDVRPLAVVHLEGVDPLGTNGVAFGVLAWDADHAVTCLMYPDQAPEMGEAAASITEAAEREHNLWHDRIVRWLITEPPLGGGLDFARVRDSIVPWCENTDHDADTLAEEFLRDRNQHQQVGEEMLSVDTWCARVKGISPHPYFNA